LVLSLYQNIINKTIAILYVLTNKNVTMKGELRYLYQLEKIRFGLLTLALGGGASLLLYVGFITRGGMQWLFYAIAIISLLCLFLVAFSFLSKKEIVLRADSFSCPPSDPIFMFRTVTVAYSAIHNIEKMTHANKLYIRIVHGAQRQQLFIGKAMLSDASAFDELYFALFYALEQYRNR